MKKYLFIAEKPSLMRDVLSTYKKHITEINNSVGEIDFISLVGHVCRLIEPKEYPEWNEKWKDIMLPMIPTTFKIDEIMSAKKILSDIKKKIKDNHYDGIIVGTDADVEGNGIYYLLANHIGIIKMPALRFYLDDQTDKGIYKAFTSMTDFYKDIKHKNMTNAYLIRSHMDWLIGMNFTIGASVKSGFTMKVGRIKTPTLKLVFDNCKAIEDFVPHTDFAVDSKYIEGFFGSLIDDENKQIRFDTEEKAKIFIDSLGDKAIVTSVEKKKSKTGAPLLYSLSDLQQDAGLKYRYTPEQVLNFVQSLYETHKIVSYPRTSGTYVSEAKAEDFPEYIKACSYIPGLSIYTSRISKPDIDRTKKDKRIVNDKEVAKASHDALMPTGQIPNVTKLSKDELNICTLIYKRFLSHFMPDLEEERTIILTDIDGNTFKSNGKITLTKGWTEIYEKQLEDIKIPDHKNGDVIEVREFMTVEKTTQPPKRFTQSSLIGAMKNAAKFVDKKELKEVMKEAEGLGQESSRAQIIKDLIKDGYMEDKKGKSSGLYITDVGRKYIENLEGYSITNPVLSAQWEYKMKQIKQGLIPFEVVNEEMIQYVKDTVKEIEHAKIEKSSWAGTGSTGLTCPLCGNSIMVGTFGYYCSKKKDGCSFSLQNIIAGKKLTEKNLKDLCDKKKTGIIKGFKSKVGKSFDASLELIEIEVGDTKSTKLEFIFPNSAKETKEIKNGHKCPCCDGNIVNDKWAWKCSKNCGFSLSYKVAGKELKESDLTELINNKKTKKISGFTSKAGKPFSAFLVLKENGTTSFEFN